MECGRSDCAAAFSTANVGWRADRQVPGDTSEKQPWLDLRLTPRNITSANHVSCLTGLSGIGANPITLLCIGGLTFAVLVAVQFLLELTSKKGEANE